MRRYMEVGEGTEAEMEENCRIMMSRLMYLSIEDI